MFRASREIYQALEIEIVWCFNSTFSSIAIWTFFLSLPLPNRVLMLGGDKVGKSSLVSQFMTSEYLHAYDTSIGEFDYFSKARVLCVFMFMNFKPFIFIIRAELDVDGGWMEPVIRESLIKSLCSLVTCYRRWDGIRWIGNYNKFNGFTIQSLIFEDAWIISKISINFSTNEISINFPLGLIYVWSWKVSMLVKSSHCHCQPSPYSNQVEMFIPTWCDELFWKSTKSQTEICAAHVAMSIGKFNKVETGYEVLPNFLSSSEIGKLHTVSVEYRPELQQEFFDIDKIPSDPHHVRKVYSRLKSSSSQYSLFFIPSQPFLFTLKTLHFLKRK